MNRPELTRCLDMLRKGDTFVIWKLDRLGRSLRDLLELVERLENSGVQFISLTEDINTKGASGRLIFHIFAVLAEFERNLIRERTMAGLATARARGRLGGARRKTTKKQDEGMRALWQGCTEDPRHDSRYWLGYSDCNLNGLLSKRIYDHRLAGVGDARFVSFSHATEQT